MRLSLISDTNCQSWVSRFPTSSARLAYKLGLPHNPLLEFDHLLEQLTELRETLNVYHVMKGMMRDTDRQPGEEVHRGNLGGSRVQELPSPGSRGAPPSPHVDVFNPEPSLPYTFGIFREASSHTHRHGR